MTLHERIDALAFLGEKLENLENPELQAVISQTSAHNPWLTPQNCRLALTAIRDRFLQKEKLEKWLAGYPVEDVPVPRKIGLVMAGNIPLVGFHDLLSVFSSGHTAQIKLSDKDPYLLPYLLNELYEIDGRSRVYFEIVDRLGRFDGVIATGSNNSARYFERYFGAYPHIIRKNRNGLAVLDGEETETELRALCRDIFTYFGLGCRNVSKLYVPEGYDFSALLEISEEASDVQQHNKYKNNFDYNLTLLLLNKIPHLASGSLLLTEDPSLLSRIGLVHYETYRDDLFLLSDLKAREEEIQCIVSRKEWPDLNVLPFGHSQLPGLNDYADGVDVIQFLTQLGR